MKEWWKKTFSISHRHRSEQHHVNSQSNQTSVVPASVPIAAATPPDAVNPQDTSLSEDLWKSAYDALNPEEQDILSPAHGSAGSEKKESVSHAEHIVDGVIQVTEKQYKEYQQGGIKIHRSTGEDIDLRRVSRKILNAALLFKDVITAVVAFDPTHHAANAWAVVSLGLTMAQNRLDLRDALFESSEYLADTITRCAYIEQSFYRKSSKKTIEIGRAMIRVYIAVLRYAAELLATQQPRIGKRMLIHVTPITNQRLTELQSAIEEEWQKLCQWAQFDALDTLVQNGKEAESRLARIDEEVSEHLQALVKRFSLPIAEGASYDSYDNQHGEKCLPGTRRDLLLQITDWAETSDKCIFWLNGMAGTGKSTISRSVAELLKQKGLLGGSFFFKKGEADRGNARRFISTIAKQLMANHRQLAPAILKAIQDDADLSTKSLGQQFEKLLLQPLSEGEQHKTTSVIVIDALDECDDGDIEILLKLLPRLQGSKSIRLRIFLTSRPELSIRNGFEQNRDYQNTILQEVSSIEHDIRIFLQYRFSHIKEKRKVPGDWPGYETTETLVQMAVPWFIFAATICRFVDEKYRVPEHQLDIILKSPDMAASSIYLPILKDRVQSSSVLKNDFRKIFGAIILLADPLSIHSLSRLTEKSWSAELQTLEGHSDSVCSVAFSSDGQKIVSGSDDKTIKLWDAQTGEELRTLEGHSYSVCSVAFSLDRQKIVSGSYDKTIKLWDAQTGNELRTLEGYSYSVYSLWDTQTGNELRTLKGHSYSVHSVAFFSDGQKIMSGSYDKTIKLWDAQTGNELRTLKGHSYSVHSVAFSSDGQKIVSGSDDKTIKLWDAQTGDELQILEGHSDWVHSVAFSSDGQKIISGSDDKTIKLWDAQTGDELQTLKGHSDWVCSVAFSSDGQKIVSGSNDNTIKLWDAQTGNELQILEGHSDWVHSVAFFSDGQKIVSGSNDNTIKLWDAQTGEELQTLKSHSYSVCWVVFSSNGQNIILGSDDNTIKLWDAQTGDELRTLKDHSDWVHSGVFLSVSNVPLENAHIEYEQGPHISVENTWRAWDGQALYFDFHVPRSF
ncbi:hypothetical protein N8T08_000778 [Aspergillus melleus]|uniref:Uncharacterized protein n=1 Tax=Aspergillus melleus TaxID=138277 RepID=A0ACC3APE2_9EURO|nr:hypothetical protein N8T08_000778 [Aspergillus melleus]